MIDQRALEVAAAAMYDHHCGEHKISEFAAAHRALQEWVSSQARVAVEAYEAALWRPIDAYDRENDAGNWILVHMDQRMPGSYCLLFWNDAFEWCAVSGHRAYLHADLVERGAQFRTMAPPSPVSGSPAAEEG